MGLNREVGELKNSSKKEDLLEIDYPRSNAPSARVKSWRILTPFAFKIVYYSKSKYYLLTFFDENMLEDTRVLKHQQRNYCFQYPQEH